jgi:cytochrome c556
MVRSIIVSTSLIVSTSAAFCQSDVIAERRNLMKENGTAARSGTQMARGETPFDAAKAKDIFAGIRIRMARFPELFPENSKTGGETKALPKIWEDMPGFRAAAAKIVQDAGAAAETASADEAAFQANFQRVTANCNSCHRAYRINPPQ